MLMAAKTTKPTHDRITHYRDTDRTSTGTRFTRNSVTSSSHPMPSGFLYSVDFHSPLLLITSNILHSSALPSHPPSVKLFPVKLFPVKCSQ